MNETDQAAILLETGGRAGVAPDWISARLAMQYYAEPVNAFHTFAEGRLKIHESDLRQLADRLRALIDADDASKNFAFTPAADPSFRLAAARLAPDEPFHFEVEATLDLHAVQPGAPGAASGENQLTLKLRTTQGRMERFLAEALKEMDAALMA